MHAEPVLQRIIHIRSALRTNTGMRYLTQPYCICSTLSTTTGNGAVIAFRSTRIDFLPSNDIETYLRCVKLYKKSITNVLLLLQLRLLSNSFWSNGHEPRKRQREEIEMIRGMSTEEIMSRTIPLFRPK